MIKMMMVVVVVVVVRRYVRQPPFGRLSRKEKLVFAGTNVIHYFKTITLLIL